MNLRLNPSAHRIWEALRIEIPESGYAELGREWNHTHLAPPYSRLYYIADGEGEARGGGQTMALRPGKIYLLPAGLDLSYCCPERMTQLYFHITACTQDGYDLFSRLGRMLELPSEADAAALSEDYLADDYLRQMRLRCRVEADVARFIAAAGLEKHLLTQHSAFLTAVFDTVRRGLSSSLTIADVARAMSVSESALAKRFRREFGMTLGRYIDEMLAQEVARALSETDESIGRIAERLGFCDQFYLSRFFAAHRGMSPSAYRSHLRGQI